MKMSSTAWIRRTLFCVALITAFGMVTASDAQQATGLQSYDVELIIFRHLNTSNTEETWTLESALGERPEIPDEDASPFEQPTSPAIPTAQTFPALPSSKFKLTAITETLRRSRNYQPLAHIGWTQPGFARDSAPFLPLSAFVPASTGVTGQLALSRGRYLHLTLDLTYTSAGSATEAAGQYVLRQSRRMRSNERHYMDHPKFGVIAVVTPTAP
jgi:hypothetical protein